VKPSFDEETLPTIETTKIPRMIQKSGRRRKERARAGTGSEPDRLPGFFSGLPDFGAFFVVAFFFSLI
jgi:hypothetical protein